MAGVAICYRLRQMGMEVLTVSRSELDARNPNLSGLNLLGASAIVNALGLINRRLDLPESDFLLVNSLFPRRLADYCDRFGIRLIHISTDCVFSGDQGPYDEAAPATADDRYGQSKYWGEPPNAMVIRTSIIGPEINNHYSLLSWVLKQKGRVPGFANHQWNGVTSDELSRAIGDILIQDLWVKGVRHVFGEDLTKFELLSLIRKTYNMECEILSSNAPQTRDTRLRTIYPEFLRALRILPMPEQLLRMRALSDHLGNWCIAS